MDFARLQRRILAGIVFFALVVAGTVIGYENSTVVYYTDTVNACIWDKGTIVASSSLKGATVTQNIKRKDEQNFLTFAASKHICTARQPLHLSK